MSDQKCSRLGCNNIGTVKITDDSYWCEDHHKEFEREYAWQSNTETFRENKVICPYCGNVQYYYPDDECAIDEYKCQECDRKFDIEVERIIYYSTKRSLCEMPEDFDPEEDD